MSRDLTWLRAEPRCYRLNVWVPSKFTCQNLLPCVLVLGGEVYERWAGHEGGALTSGTSTFIKDTPPPPPPFRPHEERGRGPPSVTYEADNIGHQTPNLLEP